MPLLLGLDTGGTFTDAVLYEQGRGVVAKAKALTTHHDLALGIGNAVEAVLAAADAAAPAAIGLVSLSTTLATNAMVEGHGGRIGLVFIGFDPADAERPELRAALGGDPVIRIAGGHDSFGQPIAALDLATLAQEALRLAPSLTGFAVTGRFGVLNAGHEIAARDLLRRETGLPVSCGHELSSRLDGPRRALTCVLNARLIHLLDRLIAATEERLLARAVHAPLMVVRGDGALVTAAVARAKPIETIFSGPAASAVGGAFLAGARDAIVSDIGGTTTDVVVLRDGRPRVDPAGALIGGFRTMVEAIAIRTCGLGGDSEVAVEQGGFDTRLRLGPRRAMPLSLLAVGHGDLVHAALDRQLRNEAPAEQDGRFAVPLMPPTTTLPEAERSLLDRLAGGPLPVDRLVSGRRELTVLRRLIDRRLVIAAALTPSDAAHVLGLHHAWDAEAAAKGAALFARRRSAAGRTIAADGTALAGTIVETLVRRSADFVLDCAFAEDGYDEPDLSADVLAQAAMDGRGGLTRLALSLTVPLVGLGASAATYYPAIARRVRAPSLVPEHAEVANAVGAVVGGVHQSAVATVLQPVEGIFRVLGGGAAAEDFTMLDAALDRAEALVREAAAAAALLAGAEAVELSVRREVKQVEAEGRDFFVEASVTAHASGRPRIGAIG